MFVSGIGGGSILRLCLLDFIAVLTVWLSIVCYGIGGDSILRLCLLDFIVVLTGVYLFGSGIGVVSILRLCLLNFIAVLRVWLSICLLVVSVVTLFYYCVY